MKPYIKTVAVKSVSHAGELPFKRHTIYTFKEFEQSCLGYVFNAYDRTTTIDVQVMFSDGYKYHAGLTLGVMNDHGIEHHFKRLVEIARHPASDPYWDALSSRVARRLAILQLADNYDLCGSEALDSVFMQRGICKMEMQNGAPVVNIDYSDISGRHQPYLDEVFRQFMEDHADAPRDYALLHKLDDKIQKALRKVTRK